MINAIKCLAMLATLISAVPAMAQQKTPTESQCREMVTTMIQAMRSAPLKTERDKQGAREVVAKAEKIVKDNRARGLSECESWAAIGKLVTTQ